MTAFRRLLHHRLFVLGLVPFVRFLILLWFTSNNGGGARHIQSLVVGSVAMIAAVIMVSLGVIADLIRINRVLIEDGLEQRKRERTASAAPILLLETGERIDPLPMRHPAPR